MSRMVGRCTKSLITELGLLLHFNRTLTLLYLAKTDPHVLNTLKLIVIKYKSAHTLTCVDVIESACQGTAVRYYSWKLYCIVTSD